jgi:hypothetical protein
MKRGSSKKMGKIDMGDLSSLLRSRNVLYLVLFAAVASLFNFLMNKQLDAVAFFIVIGFIVSYFSKNMIIVLLSAILSTFFLVQIKMLGRVQEGMEDEKKDEEEEKEEKTEEENDMESETQHNARVKKTASTAPVDGTKTKKTKETFAQKLSPAEFHADEGDSSRHKPKVDYAATLESAYDNLDKLLSSDAIRNMSDETNRLAEKQHKLMGNIKEITPIMDKASSLLSNLDIGGISKLMGGMQERLAGFSGNAAEVSAPGGDKKMMEGMKKMAEGMKKKY